MPRGLLLSKNIEFFQSETSAGLTFQKLVDELTFEPAFLREFRER
jgi:hypothetical protein